MSKQCYICQKKSRIGMNVSHSHKRTKRKWNPNLQSVYILVFNNKNKKTKKSKEYVCTKCLKAGKVTKAT